MDGENNGKPYEQMDDLGVPLFLETSIFTQINGCIGKNAFLLILTEWVSEHRDPPAKMIQFELEVGKPKFRAPRNFETLYLPRHPKYLLRFGVQGMFLGSKCLLRRCWMSRVL